ncbi:unnamed protein product [Paramecium primaurelia]|uniref:Alpha-type protein kinase domain-containing protein n=1 Tax=Paramecium primaurelia TaxID=5886 RepID=A0A8S1MY12_PARPR|nr:unnamed protein product [Paramecium primaurelia]
MNQNPQILDTITNQDVMQNTQNQFVNQPKINEEQVNQQGFQRFPIPNQINNNQFKTPPFFVQGMPPNLPQGMPPNMPQGMPPNMPQGMPPNMPQGMPPNMPQGMPPNMPQGMPPNMPQGMPPNMPQGMPPNMPQGMPPNMPQGMPPNMPQGMPPNMPQGMPPNMPQGMPPNMPQGMPPNMPQGMPPNMPQGMPPNMPQGMPPNMPQGMPPNMPQGMPPNMPQGMPPNMPQGMPPNMPQGMPPNMPQGMPPNMPQGMPPNMPQGMPPNMPQGMPPNMPQGMPPNMPQGMPPNMPQGMPPNMPQGMPPNMPQGMPPNMPQGMPPNMPQGMPPNMPQGMPPNMPQGMPPNMPQGMPPNMPQGMPPNIPQGMPPNLPQGMPGMLPGMQQGMPGMPGMLPGLQQGMPGMIPGMQQGMQQGMVPPQIFNSINSLNSIGQFPQPQFNQNLAKNQDENQKQQLDKLKKEIEKLTNEIEGLNEEKQKIENDSKKKNSENNDLKQQLEQLTSKLEDSQRKYDQNDKQLKGTIINLEQKIKYEMEQQEHYKNQYKDSEVTIKKLNTEIQNLKTELKNLKETNENATKKIYQYNQQNDEAQNQKKKIQDYQNQIKQKDDKIAEQNLTIENLKQVKAQQNQDQQVVSRLQQQLSELNQKINDLSQENKHLQGQKNNFENDYKNIQNELEILQIEIKKYQRNEEFLKESLQQAYLQLENNSKNLSKDQAKEYEDQLRKIKESRENDNKIVLENFAIEKNRILQKQQEDIQKQKQLNNLGKQKMNEFARKASSIQCCFLIDLIKSSEKIGNAIIKAAETCCTLIKKTTNRESYWGAVCYGYNKKEFNLQNQQFSNSPDILSGFLKRQKLLKDPKDQPEDLKSALQNMLTLNWSEKYKLAIVIANSPCHGKRYHNPKKYFKYFFFKNDYDIKPNDDMEEIIKEIIKRDIILLVIRFNDETKVMCNELEKTYAKLKYPQLFFTLSVKGLDQKNSEFELIQQIQKMAAFIIGTDNKTTRTKINQQVRMQNFEEGQKDMKNLKEEVYNLNNEMQKEIQNKGEQQEKQISINLLQDAQEDIKQYEAGVEKLRECSDGALQALCKKGDIFDFDKKAKCQEFSCKVYKVELKQESFKKKIETIEQISYKSDDFDLKFESEWQCIRTYSPFAFGMMKAVYLMKKKNNTDEIYVVKIPIQQGPYKSKEQAVNDCRSHLIAKSLMKDFMEQVSNNNKGIQIVQYTDFLLLEENEHKYWIAERFFKGTFEKYNNNDGYISDAKTELNAISQAFSYFTYQKSSFNYIVNDIQGVGNYFTDPAINTIKGNFDETDVGEDGISSYLSTLQMRKGICEQLLKSIDIEID